MTRCFTCFSRRDEPWPYSEIQICSSEHIITPERRKPREKVFMPVRHHPVGRRGDLSKALDPARWLMAGPRELEAASELSAGAAEYFQPRAR